MTIEEKDFHVFGFSLSAANTNQTRWITGLANKVKLSDDFCEFVQLKTWCLENCSKPVSFFEYDNNGGTVYFYEETDAVAFKLRWVS